VVLDELVVYIAVPVFFDDIVVYSKLPHYNIPIFSGCASYYGYKRLAKGHKVVVVIDLELVHHSGKHVHADYRKDKKHKHDKRTYIYQ